MSELKPCPFCGEEIKAVPGTNNELFGCEGDDCPGSLVEYMTFDDWNTRPIEDKLQARIAELAEMLHDEMGQLEIATDLGNKRWLALNDIYENGEKHNANWCKRKAQEGLGIR